jgi:hypothetical protein
VRKYLILLFLVTGCHTPLPEPPQYPMTGEAPALDGMGAADIAADLQRIIATRVTPSDGTIAVSGNDPAIDKALLPLLKANGYRVWSKSKREISYTVGKLGPALLVRLRIDDLSAARLYYADPETGRIVPASPASITEAG